MSQGPGAQRSSSSPFQNNRQSFPVSRELRTLPPIHDSYTNTRSAKSVSQSPVIASTVPNGAYPTSTPPSSEQRPASRPIGVQNLLNPAATDSLTSSSESQSRRRNADHFNLPSSLFATAPRMLPASFVSSPRNVALPSVTPPSMNSYPIPMDPASRRTLHPRSPSTHVTLHSMSQPQGTIDAIKSPFGASRELNKILGPESKNVPDATLGPPLVGAPHLYSAPSARSPPDRRTSMGSLQLQSSAERRASVGATSQVHTSQSDSPTTSYSSYSQFSRTPPVSSNNQPSSSGYFPAFSAASSASTITQAGFDSKESFGPVTSSMRQNSYQMTLDTDQGPIQVPVDVQAASKVADEKRKRNATASHRFRQRRKEKERETSQNIAKLEHQLRDLLEERDFYRVERDYFRGLANNPGQPHITPRPTSPRLVRQHAQLGGGGGGGPTAYGNPGSWPAPDDQGMNRGSNGRNTRRRTSSYVPAQGLAPSNSSANNNHHNNNNNNNHHPPPPAPSQHPLRQHPHHPPSQEAQIDPSGSSSRHSGVPLSSLKGVTFDPKPPPLGYDNGWKPPQ